MNPLLRLYFALSLYNICLQIHRTNLYSSFDTSSSDDVSNSYDEVDRMSRMQTAQTQPGYGLELHPTAISRIATQRSQHSATVAALRSRPSRKPLPEFGAGKPYPPPLPEKEEVLVSALFAFTTFNSTFASSIFSAANSVRFSLRCRNYSAGVYPFSLVFLDSVFQFAVATAENLQTVVICRSFGGFFGACPIAVVAAVFSDIYDNRHCGLAITIFTMMVFTGPLFAPFIGGFIVESYPSWRWTEYLTGIMGAAAFVLDLFPVEEMYPPVVLIKKAEELRRRTKNMRNKRSRPVRILFSELVLLLVSIYMAFLYGLLYLFYDRIPYCKLSSNNDIPIPEWRLPPAIIGAAALAGGLFWFGWTGYKTSISWIVPTASGLLTGFGLLCIFLQCLNSIIDTYLVFAASALAANSFLRSMAGAGFPLFAPYMTGSLLGCVAAVLMPIPLLFYLYGSRIRQKSKFAAEYTTVVT
ncbi:major facilitator superfamily domain-containing protein [Aspergillus cavernicola]|uniref:Major facilitator superfamily domain-containing protein n=1 Tax=Aspergillus cavernicola TaxID=176166 RepID=A0ABR4HWQ8_9EURO